MTQELSPPSLLEFPALFAIKAMGLAQNDFADFVLEIVRQTFADAEIIYTRPSGQGKYLAVTIQVTAIHREQLDNVYRQLTCQPRVLMAL